MFIEQFGSEEEAVALVARTRIWRLAESLGGVESLIEHPAIMTHASVPQDRKADIGLDEGLIRLSCGVEDPVDLVADVTAALDASR